MLQGLKVTINKPQKLTFPNSLPDTKSLLAKQFSKYFSVVSIGEMFVLPQVHMLKLNLQGGSIRWWGIWEMIKS